MSTMRLATVALVSLLVHADNVLVTCPGNLTVESVCLQDSSGSTSIVEVPTTTNYTLYVIPRKQADCPCRNLSSASVKAIQNISSAPFADLSSNLLFNANDILQLPRSIEYLSLSLNQFKSLEDMNLTVFPNLRTLIMRGNKLASIRNVSFPQSLITLDLSDNPVAVVEVSEATFTQMAKMNISLQTIHQRGDGTLSSMCTSGHVDYLASSNVVCVLKSPSQASTITAWLVSNGVVVLCMAVLISFGVRSRCQTTGDSTLRETFVSSYASETSPLDSESTGEIPSSGRADSIKSNDEQSIASQTLELGLANRRQAP
ncbi:hypothetical protein AC1031_001734 [Aphanomyces cochlioides]|nr:hypothetical protein AC1031_001734 [Aphanomyces cochlioides]